jgi:agmatinase
MDRFELVELAPMLDPTYVSALHANRIIKECMTGIAMRKKGLTDPHYLSPLTRTHGQN